MLHVVVPDGLFGTDDDDKAVVHRLPPPTDNYVEALLRTTAQRVLRMLARKIGDGGDLATDEELAALEAASLQPGARGPDVDAPARRLVAFLEGFSLHAATKVHENDRRSGPPRRA